jgi:hypothetical protein
MKCRQCIHKPNSPAVETPTVLIDAVTASFGPIAVDPPEQPPVETAMSVNATTTTGHASTNSLKGTALAIFNGDRSRSDAFWNEFRCYWLLNRNNNSISTPFYRILTALSYIKGPLVEDWVNAQASTLEERVDTTHMLHVAKTDEVLWTEFESDFKSAWKDTAHTQSAYDQLMKLQMKELDIDTYNATFERLANTAEWEPDVKGTIARYRAGLCENIHCRVVNRENLPNHHGTSGRKQQQGRKSVESKSCKALDSLAHTEISHVTSTHIKPGINTHPIPRQTTSTSLWTLTLPI